MRIWLPAALISVPLAGAELRLTVEVPRLNVAEYHRPYVAIWVEKPDQTFAGNLAVWYEMKKQGKDAGATWLKDMRQWWRKSGRNLEMPVDGVSGATRPAGSHSLVFAGSKSPLDKLPAGAYEIVIEAAREVGGRELLRIPFQWPPKAAQNAKAQGQHELGALTLTVAP